MRLATVLGYSSALVGAAEARSLDERRWEEDAMPGRIGLPKKFGIEGRPVGMRFPPSRVGNVLDDSAPRPTGKPYLTAAAAATTASTTTSEEPASSATATAFGGRCRDVSLGGHGRKGMTTLEAQCVDDEGEWWRTSLNLNECIGTYDGELIYVDGGNFDTSCRPCRIAKPPESGDGFAPVLLECNCIARLGSPRYSALLLDSPVENPLAIQPEDGRLVCGNHRGETNPML